MEATILSSDSANGLLNSSVTGGNLKSEHGSALPFSTILQSQQQSKFAANSPMAAHGELLHNQTHPGGGSETFTLDQLSLSGHNGTAAAPWLVLGSQGSATQDLDTSLSESEEVLLASMPELQLNSTQSHPLLAAALDVGMRNMPSQEQGSLLADGEIQGGSLDFRQGAGGGGNPQLAGYGANLSVGTAGGMQTLTPGLPGTQPENNILAAGTNELTGVSTASVDGDVSGLSGTSRHQDPADPIGLGGSAATDAGFGELSGDSELLSMTRSATLTGDSLGSSQGGASLSASSAAASGSLQQPGSESTGQKGDTASNQFLQSFDQNAGEISIASADLNSAANERVDLTGASASLGASVADPLNSQLRNAASLQAKRSGATDRVDLSMAVDASDGYHWLSGEAGTVSEPVAELNQTGMLESVDGNPLATANGVTPATNNARNEAAVAESFASVKRSADIAASGADTATESTEQANTASLEIDTPVQDAQWSQALAYRVQFMAQEGIQRAQVQLNPAELGPMEITVDLAEDVAQVQITAENASTLEAVEQAVPRLREIMALSGFNETGVDLSNGNEELNGAPDSYAESLQQSNTGSRDGGSREGAADSGEQNTNGIKTLSSNEVPQRSPDGRLSFYV